MLRYQKHWTACRGTAVFQWAGAKSKRKGGTRSGSKPENFRKLSRIHYNQTRYFTSLRVLHVHSRLENESKTPNSYPDQVTDSCLHGGYGSGEIRDGFPVHLSLLMHDDQMRDLLGHRLQDTLYRLRVKNRHDELFKRTQTLLPSVYPDSPLRVRAPRLSHSRTHWLSSCN